MRVTCTKHAQDRVFDIEPHEELITNSEQPKDNGVWLVWTCPGCGTVIHKKRIEDERKLSSVN